MYPEDRPRRSVRREQNGVEGPKKKSAVTLLAQVGVCTVLVAAALLFKMSGNGAFVQLQQQYTDAMSKQVTLEEAWAQVEEMADRYAVLAFFVEPIHSIQEAFSFQPADQGVSNAAGEPDNTDGAGGPSEGASSSGGASSSWSSSIWVCCSIMAAMSTSADWREITMGNCAMASV